MRIQRTTGAVLLVMLWACGGRETRGPDTSADTTAATRPSGSAQPTAMAMLPALRAHLDSVAAQPTMLHTSMAAHQAEVTGVVDAMHADMMAAGMHSDAAYEALADSVVKGSAALGTASGKEFDRLVMQHVDQLRRLTAVYETKVAAM
jgi:uncharacterized protein (DUF1501 family)